MGNKEDIIVKLEALKDEAKCYGPLAHYPCVQMLDKAIAIVTAHPTADEVAEIRIVNDRICIQGKWYVPAGSDKAPYMNDVIRMLRREVDRSSNILAERDTFIVNKGLFSEFLEYLEAIRKAALQDALPDKGEV